MFKVFLANVGLFENKIKIFSYRIYQLQLRVILNYYFDNGGYFIKPVQVILLSPLIIIKLNFNLRVFQEFQPRFLVTLFYSTLHKWQSIFFMMLGCIISDNSYLTEVSVHEKKLKGKENDLFSIIFACVCNESQIPFSTKGTDRVEIPFYRSLPQIPLLCRPAKYVEWQNC